MGGLCVVGGITGFVRTRSVPSLVAGVTYVLALAFATFHLTLRVCTFSVGALYLYSANSIRNATPNGLETALGAPSDDLSTLFSLN